MNSSDKNSAILGLCFFGFWAAVVLIYFANDIINALFGRVAKNKLAEAERMKAEALLLQAKAELKRARAETARIDIPPAWTYETKTVKEEQPSATSNATDTPSSPRRSA